ncbi:MAG: radical SAM protein [Oscillospiraceae bacterium]|jgi:putative methyltransferase|nr:radical SAM protein [Oscillospiraceae bacterium]
MKNITFVQANYLFGNNAHLPYAAGCLVAYAWQNPRVARAYHNGRFVFTREPLGDVVASLDAPYLVAFSCYVWNMEYNKALAKRIKAAYPDCRILFGGHQVPLRDAALLRDEPYIDLLIHGAGEEPFLQLLLALEDGRDLRSVPNLSFRAGGTVHSNPSTQLCPADYPSPYLTGVFDALYRDYDYEFAMSFETNRGCPFSCAFCDWGPVHGRVQKIPLERIEAEIAWASAHKTDMLYCVDANFGLFPRDREIADKLMAAKRRTGYPNKFRACYTKNSDETVFQLNKKLGEYGMSKGATLSFQSVDPTVLANIGRENLTLARFRELMTLYTEAGIPTDSELILGLPGETLKSFCAGVGKLIQAGQHDSIHIYQCELLPNASMADPAEREKYALQSVFAPMRRDHSEVGGEDEVTEYHEIVVGTRTMPTPDWQRANLFAILVQGLHCTGATQFLALYAHYALGVPYEDFYNALLDWALAAPESTLGRLVAYFNDNFDALIAGRGESAYVNPLFGNLTWPLEEGLFLEVAVRMDALTEELGSFLPGVGIPAEVLEELLRYQAAMLKRPQQAAHTVPLSLDFPHFFAAAFAQEPQPLRPAPCTLHIPDTTQISWADYARENVWYGRRGGSNVYRMEEVG